RVALARKPLGELARESRLTRTLQTREHDDRRRVLRELQAALLTTQNVDEFLVDDLHDLLRGVERLADLVAECAITHLARERLDDLEGNVGVDQGAADLTNG